MISSLLPIAVSWITFNSIWYPLGVVFGLSIVQALEAYVIFPFAGRRLKINALVIIIMITAEEFCGVLRNDSIYSIRKYRETDCRSFASFKDIVYTTRRRRGRYK
jgi:hypothetical protein